MANYAKKLTISANKIKSLVKSGIEQINDAINSLDVKMQENANISNETKKFR